MFGVDAAIDTSEDGLIKLLELYTSTRDRLRSTMKNSLNSGKVRLAGKLDDVLMRQGFWEDDIHFENGALSDLEANDAVASSIIRGFLDEMNNYLDEIDNSLSNTNRTMSGSTRETDDEIDKITLLYEMNTRLCEQVEIFDAIAADNAADATEYDKKASKIGQLRRQLKEVNQKLQSHPSNEVSATIQDIESEEGMNSDIQHRDADSRDDSMEDVKDEHTRVRTLSRTPAFSSSDGRRPYSLPPRPPPRPAPPTRWTCGYCGEGLMSIKTDKYCTTCARPRDEWARIY